MEKDSVKNILHYYKKEIAKAIDDLKTKGRRHRQIPNLLSSLRLLAPFCVLPAAAFGNVALAVSFIIFFSLTDMLDGFLARKFKLTSDLGSDLDAVCDKLFVSTLLVAGSILNPILLVNLAFEVLIAGINLASKLEAKNPRSSIIGKIKMICLYPLIACSFLTSYMDVLTVFHSLFGAATTLQGLAAASYFADYRSKKKERKPNNILEEIPVINEKLMKK